MEADQADVNVLQRGDTSPIQRDRRIPIRTFELVLGEQVPAEFETVSTVAVLEGGN